MENEMGWLLTYLAPPAVVAYAVRVEVLLRQIKHSRDHLEMIHYMRWMAQEQTGKTPPPYVI